MGAQPRELTTALRKREEAAAPHSWRPAWRQSCWACARRWLCPLPSAPRSPEAALVLRVHRPKAVGASGGSQAPARGEVRTWAPEQHGCSCRDSGLPGRTADLSRSWTVWILGLSAVFTLLSAQPEVLRPPPSPCQAARGAGPPPMSWESQAWAFGPARRGPTPLSQSDGRMVGYEPQCVS